MNRIFYISSPNNKIRKENWRTREPVEKCDSVPHEQFYEHCAYGDSFLIGASIRGKKHAHFGQWREDAFNIDLEKPYISIAVADGGGAYPLSRIGAKLAAHISVNTLKHFIRANPILHQSENLEEKLSAMKEGMICGIKHAIKSIADESSYRNTDIANFSTTLTLLLHTRHNGKHLITSLQVGDGLVAYRKKTKEIIIINTPDYGIYSGYTLFLVPDCVADSMEEKIHLTIEDDIESVVIMTDGIADDFYPFQKGLELFYRQIESDILFSQNKLRQLKKWIQYEHVGSYDDRTMILLYFL